MTYQVIATSSLAPERPLGWPERRAVEHVLADRSEIEVVLNTAAMDGWLGFTENGELLLLKDGLLTSWPESGPARRDSVALDVALADALHRFTASVQNLTEAICARTSQETQ